VRLLALDSSGDLRSAALTFDGEVLAHRAERGARAHAEGLVPLIQAVVAGADVRWTSIDVLAVAIGPGSFTGIRVAVAAAKALALALDRPVVAVTTLDALALEVDEGEHPPLPVIDARRGSLYVQAPIAAAPTVVTAAEAAGLAPATFTAVGTGASAHVAAAGRGLAVPAEVHASLVARGAVARLRAGCSPCAGQDVRPLYVRPADAAPQAA